MGLFDLDYDPLNDPLNLRKNTKKEKSLKTDAERRRSSLTEAMKRKIKEAVGDKCEVVVCGQRGAGICKVHHIVLVKKGGMNIGSNLIVLCGNCHANLHHTGKYNQTKMKKIVRKRSKKVKQQITNILKNRQKVAKKEKKTKKESNIGGFSNISLNNLSSKQKKGDGMLGGFGDLSINLFGTPKKKGK